MSVQLETKNISVPVAPPELAELPYAVQQYLLQMNDYIKAVHNDLQKLGGIAP